MTTIPTIGFNVETVEYKNIAVSQPSRAPHSCCEPAMLPPPP